MTTPKGRGFKMIKKIVENIIGNSKNDDYVLTALPKTFMESVAINGLSISKKNDKTVKTTYFNFISATEVATFSGSNRSNIFLGFPVFTAQN